VQQNFIKDINHVGINAYNNLACRSTVLANTIVNGPGGATGIAVNEFILAGITQYTIDNNNISNFGNGIIERNTLGANINVNGVALNNSFSIYNDGIYAGGSLVSTIDNNVIQDISGGPNNENGIYVDGGAGTNNVLCNSSTSNNNGILFNGPFVNSSFIQNQMISNSNGLYLFPSTVMGTQGAPGNPNDNQWNSCTPWSTNAIFPPTTFFVRPAVSYNPGNNFGGGISFITTIGSSSYNCGGGGGGGGTTTTSTALAVINDSTPFTAYAHSSHWLEKHSLFKYLTTVDSSLLSDTTIKKFRDSICIANMGKLETINALMADSNGVSPTDIANATAINSTLASPDTIEQTCQTVNSVILTMAATHSNYPNAGQISILQAIAPLCPTQYGNAVFIARALLSQVDSNQYLSSCEIVADSISHGHRMLHLVKKNGSYDSAIIANVYPNPANTKLNIELQLQLGAIVHICLYNSIGQLMQCEELQSNLTTLPISNLSSGLYYYRITDENGNVLKADKQMIIH
jgi:hypothetical protein